MSKKTGKSMTQLKDDMSKGKITFDMVKDAMKSATSQGGMFNGAMEKQSHTMSGLLSTMQDNLNALAGQLSKPLFDLIKSGIEKALPFIDKINGAVTVFFDDIGKGYHPITALQKALETILPANIVDKIVGVATVFNDLFLILKPIAINILKDSFGALTQAFEFIKPVLNDVYKLVVFFFESLVEGADDTKSAIDTFGDALIDSFQNVLGINISGIIEPFLSIAGHIQDAFQWIINNKESVIGAIVGFGTAMLVFQNIEMIMTFVNGIQTAIFVFQNLRGAVNLAAEAQALFNIVMEANPFGLIATAIGVAVGAIIYLWNTNQGFRNFWITVWNEITTIFSSVVAVIMPLFNNIASYISSLWSQVGGFGGIWNSIWNEVMILFNTVVAFLTPLFLSIQNLIQTIWNPLSYIVIPLVQSFTNTIMNEFNTIKAIVTNVMNIVKFIITTAISLISANWSNTWNLINNLTASIFNNIRNYITTTINSISSIISGVLGVIHGIFTGNLNEISSSVGRIFNGLIGLISNPLNTARGIVSDAVSAIVGFFSNIRIPPITLPHINLPHFSINGSFSLNPPSIPTLGVDWYADGGILTSPTVFGLNGNKAMVGGEAGAEAVLPLSSFYAQLDKNFDKMINAFLTQKMVLNNDIYIDKTLLGRSVADVVIQENNFRKL